MDAQAHLSLVALSEMAEKVAPLPPDAQRSNKPRGGGLWTSTYTPDAEDISGWVEWCRHNDWGTGEYSLWVLTPRADATVVEIDSYADLVALHRAYGRPTTFRYGPETVLDWLAIAADVDAVHLTERGLGETHLSHPYDLYGWDCESTVWFKWAFTTVERIGTIDVAERWASADVP